MVDFTFWGWQMTLENQTEESFKLNPEKDFDIDINNLSAEFRFLPILMYRYTQAKAVANQTYEERKAFLKELKAVIFKSILQKEDKKPPDSVMSAEIDSTEEVAAVTKEVIQAQHDLHTLMGAVDSIKAKKDMLIQIGADARKEQ